MWGNNDTLAFPASLDGDIVAFYNQHTANALPWHVRNLPIQDQQRYLADQTRENKPSTGSGTGCDCNKCKGKDGGMFGGVDETWLKLYFLVTFVVTILTLINLLKS